jgi:protein SYS1
MFYGAEVWDPVQITSQIISLQACFYLVVGFWAWFLSMIFGSVVSLDYIFSADALSVHYVLGWAPVMAHAMTIPVMCAIFVHIVERARKCLDFATTVYGNHLVLCWITYGFPTTWEWWALNVTGMIVTILLSEYLCYQKEMQTIPVSSHMRVGGRRAGSPGSPGSPGSSGSPRAPLPVDTTSQYSAVSSTQSDQR